jgi:hypothetical protein
LRESANGEVPSVVPTSPEAAETQPATRTLDADLSRVLAAWPNLPQALKAAVLALVNAAGAVRSDRDIDME